MTTNGNHAKAPAQDLLRLLGYDTNNHNGWFKTLRSGRRVCAVILKDGSIQGHFFDGRGGHVFATIRSWQIVPARAAHEQGDTATWRMILGCESKEGQPR